MHDKLKNILSLTIGTVQGPYQEAWLRDFSNWDSMNHMILITKVESTFNVQLTGEEIASLKSVQELVNLLEKKSGSIN